MAAKKKEVSGLFNAFWSDDILAAFMDTAKSYSVREQSQFIKYREEE
jgi:hypothetical protein